MYAYAGVETQFPMVKKLYIYPVYLGAHIHIQMHKLTYTHTYILKNIHTQMHTHTNINGHTNISFEFSCKCKE